MDSSKLEKEFKRSLPLRYRIKNAILDVSDFCEAAVGLFELSIMFLVAAVFAVVVAPFVFLYEIFGFFFKRR